MRNLNKKKNQVAEAPPFSARSNDSKRSLNQWRAAVAFSKWRNSHHLSPTSCSQPPVWKRRPRISLRIWTSTKNNSIWSRTKSQKQPPNLHLPLRFQPLSHKKTNFQWSSCVPKHVILLPNWFQMEQQWQSIMKEDWSQASCLIAPMLDRDHSLLHWVRDKSLKDGSMRLWAWRLAKKRW